MPRGKSSCIYAPEYGMFRVTKTKGKSVSNGGFGVSWSTKCEGSDGNIKTYDYLFVEEALFLHERGLIDVFLSSKSMNDIRIKCISGPSNENNFLIGTRELYIIMLHELKIPLASYLTYALLRSQSYIVLRHSTDRLNLVTRLEQFQSKQKDNLEDPLNTKKRKRPRYDTLRRELRSLAFHAPTPSILGSKNDLEVDVNVHKANVSEDSAVTKKFHLDEDMIAFECYNPKSCGFRKTNPGIPDFLVAITPLKGDLISFSDLKSLVDKCNSIPLRVAAVAESGTVLMFSITDKGVPIIKG